MWREIVAKNMRKRFTYIGASYLILVRDEKILLLRRSNTGFEDGNYGLPAGHLEGNETARQGGAREFKEEIGIDVDVNDLKIMHVMHRKGTEDERVDFFMTIDNFDGEVKNCEPEKHDDLRWFPINQLPLNTILYVRQAIECYLKGIFY